MNRILFVILGEKGHIHPFLGPAAHLVERGAEVAFFAPVDIRASLERAGFERFFAGSSEVPPPPDLNRGAEFAALVRDAPRLRAWIKAMLVDSVPGQVEALRHVVREWRPDLLVLDPMAYAGAIVAGLEDLPWAGFSTSLNPVVSDATENELIATTRWLHPARTGLFERYGLTARFRVCDCLSPSLNVCFATPELVGAPPPDVELVGPSLVRGPRGDETPFPWSRLDGRPLVFMSLGSQIYHQPAMFRAVIDAARELRVQLVLSVGELNLGPHPDWVITARYVPQIDLLARTTVFVTHGGANSVMEAMASGVPLLVSPICNDQLHNAEIVARAGAGVVLDLARAPARRVAAALAALLGSGSEREAAARIGAAYRQSDGAARAAELALRLLR